MLRHDDDPQVPLRAVGQRGDAVLEAAAEAVATWTRVTANMALGAYEVAVAETITTEPQWPDASFQDLLRIAFKGRLITDLSHPVIKRLRGLS